MPTQQTLWIARHGNRLDFVHPEWFDTAPRRYDPPLSADGEVQARQLADRLCSEPIRQIIASPFRRCVQTAHAVAEVLKLPVQLEWGIGEWLNADWMTAMPETAPIAELQAEFPWVDPDYRSITPPRYPETEPECLARSGRTARAIADRLAVDHLASAASCDILFVGHGATVHGMIWGLQETREPITAPLCCLTRIDREFSPDCTPDFNFKQTPATFPPSPAQGITLSSSARLILNCDTSHLSEPIETFRLH